MRLRLWRKSNFIKQLALAEDLGVTQAAISRWENGLDIPSPTMSRRLADIMARTDRSVIPEGRFIEKQSTVRAIFDIDGVRLMHSSQGFKSLWPNISEMTSFFFIDYLIGESSILIYDEEYNRNLRNGAIISVSGVSDRHVSLDLDSCVRHRWHICKRSMGARVLIEMAFEPCDHSVPTGIEPPFFLDDLKSWVD
jgi:transcriptional regulator with XRE-family HTH domain